MTQAEKIVQQQLDYYNAHDLEGFASTYHQDVELYSLDTGALILKGQEALKARYKERLEASNIHAELVNHMVIGDKIIDYEHVTTAGSDKVTKAVAVYYVEDGLIRRVYFIHE